VIITRQGFTDVVRNSFSGLGFSLEAPTTPEFPHETFLPDSDLNLLERSIDDIVFGLTKWEPKTKNKGLITPPKITITGKDYLDALANMNSHFLRNNWGDGLAIFPPTEDRVRWILRGTDLPDDAVIGHVQPQGRIATVKALAVSLAMAGGRPEYMPVLIAIIKALSDPDSGIGGLNATTGSCFPAVVVNGPMTKQIRLGSGYGCMGPDPNHPAGASIGRAVRLIMQNLGGAIPGLGTMAIYGGPARYTNVVFAEDEDGLPAGWEPLSVDRGYSKGSNVVTVHVVEGAINVGGGTVANTEEAAKSCMFLYAGFIHTPVGNFYMWGPGEGGEPGIVVMARGTARGLAKNGWTKKKIQEYLWENTKLSWDEVEKLFGPQRIDDLIERTRGFVRKNEPWPICVRPEQFLIAVAGGSHSGHGYWLGTGLGGNTAVSAEMELPKDWVKLLDEAEKDLGPVPLM
jgi:hypothetical protein